MKKYRHYFQLLISSALLAVLIGGCDTAKNTEDPDLNYFVKYYGGDGDQHGVDMVALSDGTFLLLGYDVQAYVVSEISKSAIYLLRVTAEGDVLWETHYGAPDEIWIAKDLEPTNDGNFIVVADYKGNFTSTNTDVKLVKFSSEGEILATSSTYFTTANYKSRTVTPLRDGGFMVSGTTDFTQTFNLPGETDPDLGDIFNLRVDDNLNRFPSNDWGPVVHGFGSNLDVAVKLFQVTDTTSYVFGYTNSTVAGDLNPNERLGLFYFERNSSGTTARVWYPGNIINVNDTEINYVQSVPATLGGGYLLIGTSQNTLGVSEIFVARMRPTLTFSNPLSNEASFYSTTPLGRNIRGISGATSISGEVGYLVLGDEVRGTGARNFWLSKIDQSGQVLWSTTFGSEAEDDSAGAVTELPDGKIVILGTMGLATNQFKMAFVKVNRRGQFLK
jgi:hypothetical protein